MNLKKFLKVFNIKYHYRLPRAEKNIQIMYFLCCVAVICVEIGFLQLPKPPQLLTVVSLLIGCIAAAAILILGRQLKP